MTLKDKRVVTKSHNPQWPKSVKIKKLFSSSVFGRCQFPGQCLQDHGRDFLSSVRISQKGAAMPLLAMPAAVKVAAIAKGRREKAFILTDNCAAIGASDVPSYFKGEVTPCNYGVKGVDAATGTSKIGMSQSGAAILEDDQGREFIGRCGGGYLKASPGVPDEIIWSMSQMLHAYDHSDGAVGAHVTDRNAQLKVAGGRAVNCVFKGGLCGVEAELINDLDPRWLSLEHAWPSPDTADADMHVPPRKMDPKLSVLSRKNFKVFNMTVECED